MTGQSVATDLRVKPEADTFFNSSMRLFFIGNVSFQIQQGHLKLTRHLHDKTHFILFQSVFESTMNARHRKSL